MDLNTIRKSYPELSGLDDDGVVDVLHQAYYADLSRDQVAAKLGVKAATLAAEAKQASRGVLGAAKDSGISLLKGAIAVPEAAVGLADMATGGRVGRALEVVGYRPAEARAILDEQYTEAQKASNQEFDQAEGVMGKLDAAVRNPSVIGHAALESAPSMLGGAGVARQLLKVAPRIGAVGAAAAGEGIVGAGAAAERIRQQTDDRLLTPGQSGAAAASGVGTALLGALGGKVAQKLGIGDVDTMLTVASRDVGARKGVVRATLEGAASEGLLEELPQSVQEQVWQNHALGRPLDTGVDEAIVLGTLTGGLMGGGAAAVSRPGDVIRAQKVPEAGTLSKAVNAGIESQAAQADAGGAPAPMTAPPEQAAPRNEDDQQALAFKQRLDGLSAELLDEGTRAAVRDSLGPQALDEVLYYLNAAKADGLPGKTADNMLSLAERILQDASLTPVSPIPSQPLPGAVGLDEQLALAGPAAVPQIPLDTSPTGVVRVSGEGVAAPETRADAISTRQAQEEREVLGKQAPTGPRSPLAPSGIPALPLDEAPTGRMVAGADGVRAETNVDRLAAAQAAAAAADAEAARAELGKQARRASAVHADPAPSASPVPARMPVPALGFDQSPTGTMIAGEEGVRPETKPEVLRRQQEAQRKAEIGLTPDVERAHSMRAGDIKAPSGGPFRNQAAARLAQKREGGDIIAVQGGWVVRKDPMVGEPVDKEWMRFSEQSGTMGIPRADMPQIKAEHRGAMVQFLKGKGIEHEQDEVAADSLKPTQAEFSPAKVAKAREFTGGDRSILVSEDGHVVDGHHQWMAKREAGEPVKVIRLKAPVQELLEHVKAFPSAEQSEGAEKVQTDTKTEGKPDGSSSSAPSAGAERSGADGASVPDAGEASARGGAAARAGSDIDGGRAAGKPAGRGARADAVADEPGASRVGSGVAAEPAAVAAPSRRPAPKHPATVRGSRALAEISSRLGGVAPSLLPDLSERVQRERASKKGKTTKYITWDNPAIPGVGPLFRMGGTADLSEIARVLEEAGYLEPGAVERDPLAASQRAEEIIKAELRNGGSTTAVGDAAAVEAEMRARADAEMDSHREPWEDFTFTPEDLEESGYSDASETIKALTEQLIAEAEALNVDTETIREDVARNVGEEASQDDYHAATQEAIRQAIAEAQGPTGQRLTGRAGAGNQGGGAPSEQAGRTGSSGDGRDGGPDEGLILQSQSEEDLRAKDAREAAAREQEQREQQRLADKAKVDAELGEFTLTGSNRAVDVGAAAGQDSLFAEGQAQERRSKITDAGQELTRNRRAQSRGLRWEDIAGDNDALKVRRAKKANVWPKPDYEAMVEGGMDPVLARLVKQVYDAIPAEPKTVRTPTDDQLKAYMEVVDRISEKTLQWVAQAQESGWLAQQSVRRSILDELKSKDDIPKLIDMVWPVNDGEGGIRGGKFVLGKPNNTEALLLGKKTVSSLQFDGADIRKARKEVEGGWPAKRESWQVQGMRVVPKQGHAWITDTTQYVTGGKRDGFVLVTGGSANSHYGQFAEDRQDLQRVLDGMGDYLLLDDRGKVLGDFGNEDDAKQAARERVARVKEKTFTPEARKVDAARRVGPQRRTKDVSGEELRAAFGFRGVNYGNWVNERERQLHTNHAYDALMDLADLMGVDPKALSLGGSLGLAIGAQGNGGRNAAHFVPGVNEINITRTAGVGALAHEFGHALDHYFAAQNGETSARSEMPFITHFVGGRSAPVKMRAEVFEAFREVVSAMEQRPVSKADMDAFYQQQRDMSAKHWDRNLKGWLAQAKDKDTAEKLGQELKGGDLGLDAGEYQPQKVRDFADAAGLRQNDVAMLASMAHRAFELRDQQVFLRTHKPQKLDTEYLKASRLADGARNGPYWSQPTEMFARAFGDWVRTRLEKRDQRNDYLDDNLGAKYRAAVAMGLEDASPFLEGKELERVTAAIDRLVDAIDTRDGEDGLPVMFARASSVESPEVVDAIRKAAREITGQWKNAPEVVVLASFEDAPQRIKDLNRSQLEGGASGVPSAFFYGDKVFLVATQMQSREDVRRFIFHEAIGHLGLRGVFGKDLHSVLDQMWAVRRRLVEAKATEYGLDVGTLEGRRMAAEELLAEWAESQPRLGFVQRAVAAVRAWLRRNIAALANMEVSDDEIIAAYLLPARGFIKRGELARADLEPAFSRSEGTYEAEVVELLRGKRTQAATIPATPDALIQAGLPQKPLKVTKSVLEKMHFDHGLTMSQLKRLPQLLADPLMVFNSATVPGSHVVWTREEATGMPLIVAIKSDGTVENIPANVVTSAYGRSDHVKTLERWADGGLLVAAQKKDALQWLTTRGLRLPKVIQAIKKSAGINLPDGPGDVKNEGFARSAFVGLTAEQLAALEHVGAFGGAKPGLRQQADTFRANLGLRLKQALVDQFAPLREVDERAYLLARMTKGADGTLEAAMLYGKPYLRDGVPDVDINDGGFAKTLASLQGEHQRFLWWVAAQRAERLKGLGLENLFSDKDIQALKSLDAGQMTDGTGRAQVYAKALQDLSEFNDSVLNMASESGLISQETAELFQGTPYVPFYRVMEDGEVKGVRAGGGLTNQKAWKKLKGGTEQLSADLLSNVLMNWGHLYAAAAKNRAAIASIDAALQAGVAYPVEAGTKGAVKIMRDGVAEHYAIEDPYILQAISAMSYVSPEWVKPLAKFKQILTMGVTLNPAFKVKNLIRDSVAAVAQSDLGANVFKNVKQGLEAGNLKSQTYASMLASGGVIRFGAGLEDQRSRHAQSLVLKAGGKVLDETAGKKLLRQMGEVLDWYQDQGDRFENVNRVALYKQLREKGYDHAEASFMARDLMDFSMSGQAPVVRFLVQTVPFLNARMQGLYKLGRAAAENPRKFGAVVGSVAMASLALMLGYEDDEDFKKREDWDRDTYWWFKIGDTAYRVPKPFEVGAFGTLAERSWELLFNEDMDASRYGKRLSSMLFQTFAFDPTPQAVKPLLDIYANRDSFTGRAIEPVAMERRKAEDRYDDKTTGAARLLGALGLPDPAQLAKGRYEPLSPIQIDYLTRAYFGWVGASASAGLDFFVRGAQDRGERPSLTVKDLSGAFVEKLPGSGSRYVSAFYDQLGGVEEAMASYKAAIKAGDSERAAELRERDGEELAKYRVMQQAKKSITSINQEMRRVEGAKDLSAEEKRARLDILAARRSELARRAVTRQSAAAPA